MIAIPLPLIKYGAALAVVAAAAAGVWINGYGKGKAAQARSSQTGIDNERKAKEAALRDLDALKLAYEKAAVAAAARVSDLESRNNEANAAATALLAKEKANANDYRNRWRAAVVEHDRLRDQLTAYAAGAGDADSLTACQGRAAALGNVLEACVRAGREAAGDLAGAAEGHAADVRAMLKAWPVSTSASRSD